MGKKRDAKIAAIVAAAIRAHDQQIVDAIRAAMKPIAQPTTPWRPTLMPFPGGGIQVGGFPPYGGAIGVGTGTMTTTVHGALGTYTINTAAQRPPEDPPLLKAVV